MFQLKGEIVKGVFRGRECENYQIYILFESGYALVFNTTHGSYWILPPFEVNKIISQVKAQAESEHGELREILKLAGEP